MSQANAVQENSLPFFDQNQASRTFNNNLRGFINAHSVHTPAGVKKWIRGINKLYAKKGIKTANERWYAGLSLSDPCLTLDQLNTEDLCKSCEGIYQFYAYEPNK